MIPELSLLHHSTSALKQECPIPLEPECLDLSRQTRGSCHTAVLPATHLNHSEEQEQKQFGTEIGFVHTVIWNQKLTTVELSFCSIPRILVVIRTRQNYVRNWHPQ